MKGVHLNDDMKAEILILVPVKTLFRGKCVCRNWHTLISDPNFMKRFLTRLNLLQPCIAAGVYCVEITGSDMKFLDFSNKTTDTDCLSFLPSSVFVVASHNGYLLWTKKNKAHNPHVSMPYQYTLCNPVTRERVDLPKHDFSHEFRFVVLFCYTKDEFYCQKIDFKVVCFSSHNLPDKLYVCTFSSETGKWKETWIPCTKSYLYSTKVTCNHLVYWFKNHKILHVYDLREETLDVLELPCESPCVDGHSKIGVSAGSLYYAVTDSTCFRVWRLEDRVNWSLVHNVSLITLCSNIHPLLDPICFRALAFHPLDPQIVLMDCGPYNGSSFVLYNTGTKKIERLVNSFRRDVFYPIIPYYLPPWIPFLKST